MSGMETSLMTPEGGYNIRANMSENGAATAQEDGA
jgi:hypothetical protein